MSKRKQSVPWTNVIHAVMVLAVLFVVVDFCLGFRLNQNLLNGLRSAIYPALAGSTSSLLGFVVASAAILLTINVEDHLKWMAAGRVLESIFNAFTNTIFCLTFAFALSLICLIIDRDPTATQSQPLTNCYLLSDILLSACMVSFAYLLQTVKILKDLGSVQLRQIENQVRTDLLEEAEVPEAKAWESANKSDDNIELSQ